MNVRNKKLFKYLFFILFLSNCKKTDNQIGHYTFPVSDAIKPYIFYTGSYWVYVDDSTGVLDSVVVTSVEHNSFEANTSPSQTQETTVEYYKVFYYESRTNSNYHDLIIDGGVNRNGNDLYSKGQTILFLGDTLGTRYNGTEYYEQLATLNIGSFNFSDVRVMRIIADQQVQHEFSNDTYLYFKENIGIVKKEIDFGAGNIQVWSLKRYHINQ